MRRLIEKVTGPANAIKQVASWAKTFNEFNGADRAIISPSGLLAEDSEGSGEFCEATCININEAASCNEEVYIVEVLA